MPDLRGKRKRFFVRKNSVPVEIFFRHILRNVVEQRSDYRLMNVRAVLLRKNYCRFGYAVDVFDTARLQPEFRIAIGYKPIIAIKSAFFDIIRDKIGHYLARAIERDRDFEKRRAPLLALIRRDFDIINLPSRFELVPLYREIRPLDDVKRNEPSENLGVRPAAETFQSVASDREKQLVSVAGKLLGGKVRIARSFRFELAVRNHDVRYTLKALADEREPLLAGELHFSDLERRNVSGYDDHFVEVAA